MDLKNTAQAVAWGDMWMRYALELQNENATLRAELDCYKAGYKLAMSLAKPAPKFEPETADT